MVRHVFVHLLLSLLAFSQVSAQLMVIVSPKTVIKDDVQVPYKSLNDTFKKVPGGHLVYLNSLKSDRKARSTGWTSLGLLAGGVLLIAVDNPGGRYCDTFCFTAGDIIGFFAATFGFASVGIAALITRAKANKRQRNAVYLYNLSIRDDISHAPKQSLEFGLTSSGLGIVYRF